MNSGEQRPDPSGRRPPPGDAPQFAPPSGPFGGDSGGTYRQTGRPGPYGSGQGPAFDPTAPITGPGSPTDPGAGPTPEGRPANRTTSTYRPRRRLAPTLITVGVLVLAVIVIGGGVLISRYRDQHASAAQTPGASAPAGPTTPSASGTPGGADPSSPAPGSSANSIAFTSSDASGTLSIVGHQWTTQGNPDPANDYYLAVEIQVKVDQGSMYYSAEMFEAFDATGNVYGAGERIYQRPLLSTGQLTAGQSIRGWIDFDLQRGETTVLMAGPNDQPIAALKVEG